MSRVDQGSYMVEITSEEHDALIGAMMALGFAERYSNYTGLDRIDSIERKWRLARDNYHRGEE